MNYRFYILILAPLLFNIAASVHSSFEFEKDYRIFYSVIHDKEGTLDLHTSKDSIEYYFLELEHNLSNDETLLEQFRLYSSTLSHLKCGHTQIYPNRSLLREWLHERNALPFDYYLYDGRLYFNKLDEADEKEIYAKKYNRDVLTEIPEHAEIYSIDGLTLGQMMTHIGKYISSDEDQIEFKIHQAGQLFEFYRNLALPFTNDTVDVIYISNNDTTSVKLMIGEAPVHTMNNRISEISAEENNRGRQYGEFKIIQEEYAYFRFRSFNSCGGLNYREFLSRSFRKIKEEGVNKLVIDLRGNTGGIMQYDLMSYLAGGGVKLGRYIVARPTFESKNKYINKTGFDYMRHKRMSNMQRRQSRSGKFNNGEVKTRFIDTTLVFNGEIVVVTDESTFSSAAMLACHLKTLCHAKIIGRTAGGSFYKGNSGTLHVKLPETGFDLLVNPNTFYSQLEPSDNPRAIKEPDVYLHPKYLESRKLQAYYFREATKVFSGN